MRKQDNTVTTFIILRACKQDKTFIRNDISVCEIRRELSENEKKSGKVRRQVLSSSEQ